VLTAPFDERGRVFLKALFRRETPLVAHNAVFDLRQLSKLTDGQIPRSVWDTYVTALQIYQRQRTIPFSAELIDWECRASGSQPDRKPPQVGRAAVAPGRLT
jgi:hypothetical protein